MTYVDNAVPFGSMSAVFGRGGIGSPEEVGTFILESVSFSRPSKIGERPNEIGGPNGWFAVSGFPHGACVIQIPTVDTAYPRIGDWFKLPKQGASFGEDVWVIVETSQPYAIADYYKMNATLRLAPNAPE